MPRSRSARALRRRSESSRTLIKPELTDIAFTVKITRLYIVRKPAWRPTRVRDPLSAKFNATNPIGSGIYQQVWCGRTLPAHESLATTRKYDRKYIRSAIQPITL